jgi:lipopolysaccharide assembly protein A
VSAIQTVALARLHTCENEATMRWIHITIVVLFAAATLIFLVQNREIVSMDFLGFSVRAPLAVIAASFYLLGALTGSSAYALLRRSVQAASAMAAPPPPRSA